MQLNTLEGKIKMISNIRSKSIEGYATDSAGNVIRNSEISVKIVTNSGVVTVATTESFDDGYFVTTPLPCGVYDIYESGVRVSRVIHNPDSSAIPCIPADRRNYNTDIIRTMNTLIDDSEVLNFKAFVQIEHQDTDVVRYGNSFPIYDVDISSMTGTDDETLLLTKFVNFYGMSSESRITTTRFDAEYYAPITGTSNTYRRVRLSGVPAIRYYNNSKLVLPIDYYSQVLTMPRVSKAYDSDDNVTISASPGNYLKIKLNPSQLSAISARVNIGSRVFCLLNKKSDPAISGTHDGVVVQIWGDGIVVDQVSLWSMFIQNPGNHYVSNMKIFDGMFDSISTQWSYISVFENIAAQNAGTIAEYPEIQ